MVEFGSMVLSERGKLSHEKYFRVVCRGRFVLGDRSGISGCIAGFPL